jgi:hypothetical protein
MTDDAVRGMYVAAMVRSSIESSDLAPRSHGCQDYCGCAATIVTVREFSSRRSKLPGPRWARRPPVMRSNRRGAAAPPGGG